jgi:hypothetical protein
VSSVGKGIGNCSGKHSKVGNENWLLPVLQGMGVYYISNDVLEDLVRKKNTRNKCRLSNKE